MVCCVALHQEGQQHIAQAKQIMAELTVSAGAGATSLLTPHFTSDTWGFRVG